MTQDFDTLLVNVERSLAHPEFKARLALILQRSGLADVPRSHVRHYQVATAAQMLTQGLSRADASVHLCTRFGITRRTAYRLLCAAIDSRRPAK